MTHETLKNTRATSTLSRMGRPKGAPNRPKPVYKADGGSAGAQLRSYFERVERLEAERKTLAEEIKDVYLEAHGNGFETKAIRHLVRVRAQDQDKRQELEAFVELYAREIGMSL